MCGYKPVRYISLENKERVDGPFETNADVREAHESLDSMTEEGLNEASRKQRAALARAPYKVFS